MNCPNCGSNLNENANFCTVCGTKFTVPVPMEERIPEQYRPISPWAYFGLQLLFSIPIVGFIFLIIFSCNSGNLNRRNFARSYWCGLIIVGAVLLVFLILSAILGVGIMSMRSN